MPTAKTARKRMTAEQFCSWVHRPENTNRWFELVQGEVIELPPPTRPHGTVCMIIGWLLTNCVFARGKGYLTSNDSGVILERDPDTVRGPDIAYYEDAQKFAELHPKYGEVPPRLAVEVLSPSDRLARVLRKIADYLAAGVSLVWLVDPEARTVTVYRPDKHPRLFTAQEELTGEDVLPGFRCKVADFFRLPCEQGTAPSKPANKRRRK